MKYTEQQVATLHQAILAWGMTQQLEMLQEECGETIAAINRYKRGRIQKEALAEEVADVLIMAHQARFMLGEGLVDILVDRKIARLAKRLEENDD